MNIKELRQKTRMELERLAMELRARLRDTRFNVATRQSAKVHEVRDLRKQLAQIETLLSTSAK